MRIGNGSSVCVDLTTTRSKYSIELAKSLDGACGRVTLIDNSWITVTFYQPVDPWFASLPIEFTKAFTFLEEELRLL